MTFLHLLGEVYKANSDLRSKNLQFYKSFIHLQFFFKNKLKKGKYQARRPPSTRIFSTLKIFSKKCAVDRKMEILKTRKILLILAEFFWFLKVSGIFLSCRANEKVTVDINVRGFGKMFSVRFGYRPNIS